MLKSYEKELGSIIYTAKLNEEKLQRFQTYEMQLLSVNTLPELVDKVLYDSKKNFYLDIVTIILLDPEYEFRRFLRTEGFIFSDHPALMFSDSQPGLNLIYPSSKLNYPQLGPYKTKIHGRFFPPHLMIPQSVAMLPLVRYGCLIGSLNFGSNKARRFYAELGTEFLKHLAAVVAICMENTLNHERVRCMGLTDTLTGVNNRRFFDQRLFEEVKRAHRNKESLTCLFLDIDYFKKINDVHGHQMGDQALADVAEVISKQLRQNDVLARYGGEEFTVLLSNTRTDTAMEVAERIRENIEAMIIEKPDEEGIKVTISIGVATLKPGQCREGGQKDCDLLIETADSALYQAKDNGRNQVVCVEMKN